MKKCLSASLSLLAAGLLTFNAAVAQPPITSDYYTGFDASSDVAGWQLFMFSPPGSNYTWVISSDMPYTGTHCLAHYYPVGGTDITDNWYVSPAFDFSEGATIDSLQYGFTGFGTPQTADTVGIYLLVGSQDPSTAMVTILLKDFRGDDYNNDGNWHTLSNMIIPPMAGNCYLAFRYKTTSTWMNVRYDALYISNGAPPTGIDDMHNAASVKVYPNPAGSRTISISGAGLRQFQLYNAIGQMVRNVPVSVSGQEISVEGLSSGSYMYAVTDEKGRRHTGKLTIK